MPEATQPLSSHGDDGGLGGAAAGGAAAAPDEDEPLVTILPQEVIDALAELDLELSEGRKNDFSRCENPPSDG